MKHINNIPDTLKQVPYWVNWKLVEEEKGKKPKKVPINSKTNRYANTNDANTWCDFNTALAHSSNLGFVLTNTNFIGIDVDHPADSAICKEIIAHFQNTYCEKSPSGNLRIMCLGQIPRAGKADADKAIEVYDKTSPRYLTITGNLIEGTHTEIENCQDAIDWLYGKYFQKPLNSPTSNFYGSRVDNPLPTGKNDFRAIYALSDDEILEKCKQAKNDNKFEALFSGSGHADESSGDLALAGMFAFYTKDSAQIDRLIRQSNRNNLKNGKWEKKHSTNGATYGQMTIEKAISNAGHYKSKGVTQYNEGVTSAKNVTSSNSVTSTIETVTTRLDEWHSRLAYSTKRNGDIMIKSNLYNMALITENDENLKGLFGFNEFTGKVKIIQNNKAIGLKAGSDLEDNDITQVRIYISESLKDDFNSHLANWESGEIINAIVYAAKKNNSYHPIRDYLNALEWDGTERINHFFSDHCGTFYNEYSAFVASSFFISAVARIMQPGCKVDTMVILEGLQGIGKSSLFHALCENNEWFRDSNIDLDSKDAYTGLRGKWIIEMSELDALNKAETTRIKSFITSQSDSYRPPYGKCDIDVPRQCVFAGTTNKSNYLKDETGNRRFLPVKCEYVDIDTIVANKSQLWAEAVHRYHSGEKWYVKKGNTELNKVIAEQQEARYEGDAWEEAIKAWAEETHEFSIAEVATSALGFRLQDVDRRVEIRIGKILQVLGYKSTQKRMNGKRLRVYIRL